MPGRQLRLASAAARRCDGEIMIAWELHDQAGRELGPVSHEQYGYWGSQLFSS